MNVEAFDVVGVRGRDFVIYGEYEEPRFEARLLEGSKTLKVGWTNNFPWTPHRLRDVQNLAGGPGSFQAVEGLATDLFAAAINEGLVDESKIENRLNRALGGRWSVTISRRSNELINIRVDRLGD